MAVSDYLTDEQIAEYIDDPDINVSNLVTTDLNGIFCVPYQFMDTVDRRLKNSELGRKYSDKIVSRMPLLFIAPGKQSFMEDFDSDDTNAVSNFLFGKATDTASGDVNELISGTGRYYSFEYDYAEYYKYVNAMCTSVAYFMGIHDEVVKIGGHESTVADIDWSTATSDSFQSYFSSKENVIFYCNGLTEVSESFSNSTTESSLASTINGYSDTVNEIKFLLGDGDSVINNLLGYAEDVATSLTSSLSGITSSLGGGIISSLSTAGVSNVLSGGKIIFPKIWQDSNYDKSYSLDFKLRSPDNDQLSIFLNVIVPYIHLLALCMPRQVENDPNGYSAPFLVKCFCKGMFNVDMGLITSVSATRGGEQNWNNNGIPSQIDLNIEIQDLYPGLFMTSATGDTDKESSGIFHVDEVVNNTAYMDFLSNMAGLNIAQPELLRKAKLRVYLTGSVIKNTPARLGTRLENWVTNKISKLWNLL